MNQWGLKKPQCFQLFVELRKFGNTNSAYIKKNNNVFIFFFNEEKLRSLTRAKLIYPKSLFESGKNLETLQLRPTLKNINFESIDKMGKFKF